MYFNKAKSAMLYFFWRDTRILTYRMDGGPTTKHPPGIDPDNS